MEFLLGALITVWTVLCLLAAIFLTVVAIRSLVCTLFLLPEVSRMEAFSGFVFCSLFAGLFYIHVWYLVAKFPETPKTPATRDILLTVPQDSSVNTQITSGNNTVNITDL